MTPEERAAGVSDDDRTEYFLNAMTLAEWDAPSMAETAEHMRKMRDEIVFLRGLVRGHAAALQEHGAAVLEKATDFVEQSSPGEPWRTNTISRLRMWVTAMREGRDDGYRP